MDVDVQGTGVQQQQQQGSAVSEAVRSALAHVAQALRSTGGASAEQLRALQQKARQLCGGQ